MLQQRAYGLFWGTLELQLAASKQEFQKAIHPLQNPTEDIN